MSRTARIKKSETGVADYHLMSRTNDKRFLFEKGEAKTMLAESLRRAAAFSGIRVHAYTVMSNHFHVVVRVTRTDGQIPEPELLRRVAILKGEKAAGLLAEHWKDLAAAGLGSALDSEQDALRRRMCDISKFIKTFKELFDRQYKRSREYCGSIWSGRFKSTLIEDGRYLATCIKYVLYNPIRAGMVRQAKDYLWSWSENDSKMQTSLGSVPEEWCLRKRAQITEGKVYGGAAFVRRTAFQLGDCFRAKRVGTHGIVGLPVEAGASTHGWKLAEKLAKKLAGKVAA